MTEEFRPMGIGDILDATLQLYRARFGAFLTITLVVYVPFGILLAAIQAVFFPEGLLLPEPPAAEQDPEVMARIAAGTAGVMLVVFLWGFLVYPLCQGAMVHQISATYLGEDISGVESYRRAAPRVLPMLVASILATLAILAGYVFCLVPGVIFTAWFMLVPATVMLENYRGVDALRRSRELVSGNLGKGLLLLLVVGLLSGAMSLTFEWFLEQLSLPGTLSVFVPVLLSHIVQALIVPIGLAALILFYYDLRIRKEAFDLQRLAADLGASPVS